MSRVKDVDSVAPDNLITGPVTSKIADKKNTDLHKVVTNIAPSTNLPHSENRSNHDAIYKILGHTPSPFSSFLVRPDVFSFEERDDREEIILVLRRHWYTNLKWIVIGLLMALFPSFLYLVPLLNTFPANFQFVAVLFWYLITFAFIFEKVLSWWFNVCIITDERVVDVDFNNILVKKFTDAKISMIQDVTSQVVGVAQTLFNFGHVIIQTASEIPELEFESVPNPEKVIKVLQKLREEEEQEALEGRTR